MEFLQGICCICWENKNGLTKLNKSTQELNFYRKLTATVKEMDFNEMRDSYMICSPCSKELEVAYNFRIKCLIAKTAITDYMIKLRENNVFNEDVLYEKFLNKKLVDQKIKSEISDQISKKFRIDFSNLNDNLISCENGLEIIPLNFSRSKKSPEIKMELKSEEIEIEMDEYFDEDPEMFEENENINMVDVNITEGEENQTTDQLKCEECSLVFSQYTDYIIHCHQHGSKKPFECHICLKKFTKDHLFQNHLRFAHPNEGGLDFDSCQTMTVDNDDNIDSCQKEESEKFKCQLCAKEYSSQKSLKDHLRKVHLNSQNSDSKSPFVCDICGRVLSRMAHLKDHRLSHFKDKKYECPVCQKVFHYKRGLRKHMPIHSGIKPFVCQWCQKSFNRKDNLGSHQREHCKFRFQNDGVNVQN